MSKQKNKTYNKIMRYIYFEFEHMCQQRDIEELEFFIDKLNIDVNHEEGFYVELICKRNDVELLKMFLRKGANIHSEDESILNNAALSGHIELVEFLIIECNCDYKILYESNAYSNHDKTVKFIDKYAESLKE
jgi:hypothetical protein